MAKKAATSQKEAMRQVLGSLGVDAKNDVIKDQLKSQFGVEMTEAGFNSTKSSVKKELKSGKAPARTPENFPHGANGTSDTEESYVTSEIKKVSELLKTIPAERVKALVDLLAR